MAGVTITLTGADAVRRKIARVMSPQFVEYAAQFTLGKTRNWISEAAPKHHRVADRLGATPTKHLEYAAGRTTLESVSDKSFTIAISKTPGLLRAFGNVTVKPKRANYLTVPIHATAYGKRAGQLRREGHIMFRFTSKKGSKLLGERDGTKDGVRPLYALCKSVTIPKDDTLKVAWLCGETLDGNRGIVAHRKSRFDLAPAALLLQRGFSLPPRAVPISVDFRASNWYTLPRMEKTHRSKLGAYEAEIRSLKQAGMSIRRIAAEMRTRHGVAVSHNAVASFMRTHRLGRRHFLDGIPATRQGEVMRALKAMWTHDSTAIEGNTLTLGDTLFVLQYGLTVKGKPLKDHDDVIAHAQGVDFIAQLVGRGKVTADDIKELHRIVVKRETMDIYKPVGDWKREDNGTYNAENGKAVYMAYAPADDTPQLMADWVRDFNALFDENADAEAALGAYLRAHVSFVRIHPFFDGNGRLARLLANLPVLYAGLPPVVVPTESRTDYIGALWKYQRSVGQITAAKPELLPRPNRLAPLRELLRTWWQATLDLVAEAWEARK